MRYLPFVLIALLLLSACAIPPPRPVEPAGEEAEVPMLESEPERSEEEPAAAEPIVGAAAEEAEAELPSVVLDGDLLYQILMAEIALQRHHYEAGIESFLDLAETTGDVRFAERATRAALFVHADSHALRGARLWTRLRPEAIEPQQMRVVGAIRAGELEEALDAMEGLAARGEAIPEERFELIASLLGREHDVQEALRLMERFVAAHRDDPSALYAYAHLAIRAGELERGQDAIDEALSIRPGWRDAIMLRIRALLMAEGTDAAMAYLSGAVAEYPEDAALRHAYARTLAETQRYEEALAQYEILVEQLDADPDVLLAMGMIHLQLGRIDEAEVRLRQVQEAQEGDADLEFYLGWIAEERGQVSQAAAYYGAVRPDSPNAFEARVRTAIIAAGSGDVVAARRQLQALRADEPGQHRRLYQIEAELLQREGLLVEAKTALDRALDAFPRDFDLLYARALLSEKMDRIDLVEADLRAILDRDPDHVDALNALGYTLADRTDRYREAYGYIRRALELYPNNNAILDSMGWVLYRLGNHEEAIRFLRRSWEMAHDHEVAAHLGEVLWVVGERDEALAIWRKALDAFPDDEVLRATMRRFGQ